MKPGQPAICKVPNPAVVYRKMRVLKNQRSAVWRGAFLRPRNERLCWPQATDRKINY